MTTLLGAALQSGCKQLLATPGLVERLRAENFDVGISEGLDFCAFREFRSYVLLEIRQLPALFEHLDLDKFVMVGSIATYELAEYVHGIPVVPSYVPGIPIDGDSG